MCGRFVLVAPGRMIAERFQLGKQPELQPRYNIAPSQTIAAIRLDPDSGDRRLSLLRWGLIPFWAKDIKIGYKMINARGETVPSKPAFRAAFKQRRCLIPASGFYEWKREKRKKQPFYFQVKDGPVFAFAGLWEHWESPEGEAVESCTIITTEANSLLEPVHDRMPVILRERDYELWLDPATKTSATLTSFLRPFPAEEMTAHPVSTLVNSPTNDVAECITPIDTSDTISLFNE